MWEEDLVPDTPMKGRVLVVDDDLALAEMLGIVLRGEGFEPSFVHDGDKALEAFRETKPDLVLLDLMLPGADGIDVCRQIRAESGVPIVMLTAKSDTVDIVLGLESGADDYIVKPFKPKELVARVRVRLRRTEEPAPEVLQIGDITIDVAGHAVRRDGEPISLTPLEFDLLVALARKPRQVFTARCCWSRCGGTATPRHPARQRPRAAAARQDREGSRAPGGRGDRTGRRLQGGDRLKPAKWHRRRAMQTPGARLGRRGSRAARVRAGTDSPLFRCAVT